MVKIEKFLFSKIRSLVFKNNRGARSYAKKTSFGGIDFFQKNFSVGFLGGHGFLELALTASCNKLSMRGLLVGGENRKIFVSGNPLISFQK